MTLATLQNKGAGGSGGKKRKGGDVDAALGGRKKSHKKQKSGRGGVARPWSPMPPAVRQHSVHTAVLSATVTTNAATPLPTDRCSCEQFGRLQPEGSQRSVLPLAFQLRCDPHFAHFEGQHHFHVMGCFLLFFSSQTTV